MRLENAWAQWTESGVWHHVEATKHLDGGMMRVWFPCRGAWRDTPAARVWDYRASPPGQCRHLLCREPFGP